MGDVRGAFGAQRVCVDTGSRCGIWSFAFAVGQLKLFASPVAASDCGRTRFFRRDSSRSRAEQVMAAGSASPPTVSDLREGWAGLAKTEKSRVLAFA